MRSLFAGARYEIRALIIAPATLLILGGAALFYSAIYPGPYSPQAYRDMPIYALDLDNTALSRQLLAHIDAAELLQIVDGSADPMAARRALEGSEVLGIVEIPAGLQHDVTRGESPVIGLLANAGYLLAYSQLADAATKAVLDAGGELGAVAFAESSGKSGLAAATQEPFQLEVIELFNPAGGYASFVVPAVAMVILQQTMLIGLGLLCDARRALKEGAPKGVARRIVWTAGRNIPWVGIYLLQFMIIRWIIFPVYHLPAVGQAAYLIPFLSLFLLSVSLLGLLIAEFFKSAEDVIPFLLFTSLPIVFLSGFSWPLESVPEPLRSLSYLIPSSAGVQGFVRLNQLGTGFSSVITPIVTLLAQCLLYGGMLVAVSRGRYRTGKLSAG
ncbi:ABC transporter permease [Microbulbifer celer]|uniref:ABC transporter permease n=1 Tax=Microbulbifer celer TaxID=435905 RepID=A0ABW3U7Z2_9GAMM|nr:ABC transporter permease [Microbulbifer celer]UFN56631.1 ABC transporter permease [Microbulbifer celer]